MTKYFVARCHLIWGELSFIWGELSFDWGELSNIFGATCPDFRGDLSWGELALGRVVWLPKFNYK